MSDKLSDRDYLEKVLAAQAKPTIDSRYRPASEIGFVEPVPLSVSTTLSPSSPIPDMSLEDDLPIQQTGAEEADFPFKLMTVVGDSSSWKIYPIGSSVTQQTDGPNMTITGLETERSTAGHVHVRVSITDGAVVGASVDVAVAKRNELDFDPDDSSSQTYANLYLGEVVADGETYTFRQAIREAQIIDRMFFNATICWAFSSYPSHPDSLVDA